MTGGPITLTSYRCGNCGQAFTSGAMMPSCPACHSVQLERTGTAATLNIPEPVPAGEMPDPQVLAAQVQAAAGVAQQVTYRCPLCTFRASWSAIGEPPASVTAHEDTHKGQVII